MHGPPRFAPDEIQSLFSALCYPGGQIRSDSITAVGAPSTVQYLMRAIYWLYQIARVYFVRKQTSDPSLIKEVEDEEYGVEEVKGGEEMLDERELEEKEEERYLEQHPEEKIFKDLLNQVRNYQQYSDPP